MSSGVPSIDDLRKLRRSVDWALRQALDLDELVPMLRRLARHAPPDSEDFSFAHRHLAELSVERDPWRAALSARHVIALRPEDDGSWAVLGLSFTLMGHYHAAAAAYRRAVSLAPTNPWYAHNLGHLLDVTLDRPGEAVRLLSHAHDNQPGEANIAASYVHALGRVGRRSEARKLLKRFMKGGGTADQKALLRWLDSSAVADAPRLEAAEGVGAHPRKRRTRRQAPST